MLSIFLAFLTIAEIARAEKWEASTYSQGDVGARRIFNPSPFPSGRFRTQGWNPLESSKQHYRTFMKDLIGL